MSTRVLRSIESETLMRSCVRYCAVEERWSDEQHTNTHTHILTHTRGLQRDCGLTFTLCAGDKSRRN